MSEDPAGRAFTDLSRGDAMQVARAYRVELERELCSRNLYWFIRCGWKYMDPADYIDGRVIHLMATELEKVARREVREAVFNIPPRHMKSLLTSVAFPAWIWTWWPSAKFISASYDLKLATRDAVKTRTLIQSPWYQARWGDKVTLSSDQNNKMFYMNTAGGHRFTCSPSSGITGEGADFVSIDDAHNVTEAESEADRESVRKFWFEAVPSRLNNLKTGCKMVTMQRVHTKDVAGECIRRGYYHVVLPAEYEPDHPHRSPLDWRKEPGELLWPERFDAKGIGDLKAALGSYAAAGQLQQRPTAREGGTFQRSWFKIIKSAPASLQRIVRRWDLAGTEESTKSDPDWTACVKMGIDADGLIYILHADRLKGTPLTVEKAIKNMASQDGKKIKIGLPQDPGQAGKAQAADYVRKLGGYSVQTERETGSKLDRADPFASQVEAGNVYLIEAPWNEDYLEEMCAFPNGAHDDWVDSTSGAYHMLVGAASTGILEWAAQEAARREAERKAAADAAEKERQGA